MRYKITNIIVVVVMTLILSSCSSTSALVVDNSLPKSKVIIQENPNEKGFYSATYNSVSQDIYSDNTKIHMLKDGINEFNLDDNEKVYAVYFVSSKEDYNNKSSSWKYLINSDSKNKFTITDSGKIVKS